MKAGIGGLRTLDLSLNVSEVASGKTGVAMVEASIAIVERRSFILWDALSG